MAPLRDVIGKVPRSANAQVLLLRFNYSREKLNFSIVVRAAGRWGGLDGMAHSVTFLVSINIPVLSDLTRERERDVDMVVALVELAAQ